MGVPVRASRELGVGGPGEGQPGALQGLGPGVHIVALCADARSEGEERTDATNLLYQLILTRRKRLSPSNKTDRSLRR
ncbi:hypothetical protein chiPu_0021387 [Chiloscyllium punctatum]|uniref:Uncharacterized protein n=1 Tax=Chiloscyllium punctatum TaxID=137246 RepID=A0A401REE1_CHIPU|nr:hypothetical protein [Chiloscyllium punctatum]